MEVFGNGWLNQKDKSMTKYRCRKWIIRYRTECGIKSRYFVGSYGEALKAKDNFYYELLEEKSAGSLYFKDYSERWLEWRANSGEYSPNTIQKNKHTIDALVHWFGKFRMYDITPTKIKDIMVKYESPQGVPYSGTTKNYHFACFNSILESAVEDRLIDENPFASISLPKTDTKEKKALNKREFDYMIKCLDSEKIDGRVMAIYLMLYLGLRRQEVLGLYWEDINFKSKKIHIQRAFKNADQTIGETKSKAGNRILPIPKPLLNRLKKWRDLCQQDKKQLDNVCISTQYNPLSPTALKKWFRRFREKNDIDPISFHELRHTNLTIAARNMNQFDLQRYAGWSSLAPAKVYIHADDESMKDSINSMFS